MNRIIDLLPLWGVFLATVALVLVASEIGHWLGLKRARKTHAESEGQVSALTGAHLGLLAFMMAFTFSAGADLAMKRKGLILEEANAIQALHLRAGLLGSPAAGEIQRLSVDYALMRSDIMEIVEAQGMAAALQRSERFHNQIWRQVEIVAGEKPITELHAQVVDAAGNLVSLHNKRVAAGVRSRIPAIIWSTLFMLLLLSMLGMGYYNGMKERRSPIANTALAMSFSLVIVLIADLDRPREGLMKVDQSLMRDMAQKLSAS